MHSASSFTRETFAGVLGLLCPLVFSVTGLLLDGAAVASSGDLVAPSVRFVLIAGAPALAAIAAMKAAGDDPDS